MHPCITYCLDTAKQVLLIIVGHMLARRLLNRRYDQGDGYVQVAAGGVDALLDALLARARLLQEDAKRSESLDSSDRAAQQAPTFG